jgi:hypothetical protein
MWWIPLAMMAAQAVAKSQEKKGGGKPKGDESNIGADKDIDYPTEAPPPREPDDIDTYKDGGMIGRSHGNRQYGKRR